MNRTSGFTLVDLLAAISLLAVIGCLGLALLYSARTPANATDRAVVVGTK